jgi:hypothetical protein
MRNIALSILVAVTASCTALTAPARADYSCALSEAAGKPGPAAPSEGRADRFRIFWHIATQIEDLADAAGDEARMRDIREARAIADGYYINALMAGPMTYWPDRPKQCALNKKLSAGTETIDLEGELFTPEGGTRTREQCAATQDDFVKKVGKHRNIREMQADAMRRAYDNIGLAQEQKQGKPVWGELLVTTREFSYDRRADKVKLTELPKTYCFNNSTGITLNAMMLYMEPSRAATKNTFLWIPLRDRNGKLKDTKNARQAAIPGNVHAFDLLMRSFADAGVPVGSFRPNIRRWHETRSPRLTRELAGMPGVGGFNFEGGTAILPDGKNLVENYADGMAWILQNTDKNVSLLMPGYWKRDMVGSEKEIDTQIPRLRTLIVSLNDRLSKAMGSKDGKAICSGRINLIAASYGQPIHVKTLPMRRSDGSLAGTVTGQMKLLSDVRNEICGS